MNALGRLPFLSQFLWVFGCGWPGPATGVPDGFEALAPQVLTIKIEGEETQINYRPAIKLRLSEGELAVTLHADADLANVQTALPKILDGEKRNEACGDRLTIANSKLSADGAAALLTGMVAYQRWECPELLGKRMKAQLGRMTGQVEIAFRPHIATSGTEVKLHGDVTRLTITEAEGLGAIASPEEMAKLVEPLVQREVDAMASQLSLQIPSFLQDYRPRVDLAVVEDLGEGRLGVSTQVNLTLDEESLVGLVKLLSMTR